MEDTLELVGPSSFSREVTIHWYKLVSSIGMSLIPSVGLGLVPFVGYKWSSGRTSGGKVNLSGPIPFGPLIINPTGPI